MLRWKNVFAGGKEAGDTLIEVTIALAILSMVLLGATVVAAVAFRLGQTAQERTSVSNVAQEQMEALRSFRDNHTWAEFRGGGLGYSGIDGMVGHFHMELVAGTSTEWEPVAGDLTPSTPNSTLTVPTSVIYLTTNTDPPLRDCGYDFLLQYSFTSRGSDGTIPDTNQIETRLANLTYSPGAGPALCPLN